MIAAVAIILILTGVAGIGWGVFIAFRLERERVGGGRDDG